MHQRLLTWLLLSVILLVAGVWFWRLSETEAVTHSASDLSRSLHTSPATGHLVGGFTHHALPIAPALAGPESSRLVKTSLPPLLAALRLSNTALPIGQLARKSDALLLANVWLDTSQFARGDSGKHPRSTADLPLPIPDHLRAPDEPGAYVVQARAVLDDGFRALLAAAGATIVSYIPNNAYLVRASAAAAQCLAADSRTQAVLSYEPYYKLTMPLLPLAVAQTPVPAGSALNVLLFPDAGDAACNELQDLGLELLGQERSPFGPVIRVRPVESPATQSSRAGPAAILCALARLPTVQQIELAHARVLASDLSRARVAVAADPVRADNYLGLTGTNVLVNVNDSGVDASHPDLTNRVCLDLPVSGTDTNGHGTHVAGLIAGSGLESSTVTNASGSSLPAADFQFRGLAPAARLFVMAADPNAGPASSDSYLQETAARTNAWISNNSWHYGKDTGYDLAAASYDAAVRDALPGVTGGQPLLFVFGAGNEGKGADDGTGGSPDSVPSPGTAKNVITVGALEQPRAITNEVWQCSIVYGTNLCQTNQPWLGMTDTNNEVAGFSGRGNVGVDIEGAFGRFKPDVVAPGAFVIAARSTQWNQEAYYFPTNDSNQFEVLSNLNNTVGPFYRYESGTSMSAAEVAGTLALMQEFFQRLCRTNSPALMKALLINGARSLGPGGSFQVNAATNSQGWGLVNLTNSLPRSLTNLNATASPMLLFDQSSEGALASGQSQTRFVSLSETATNQPLRATLVWTDPPGNPAASLKLVNNLDLLVTNLDTGEVFFGNDFPAGCSFNSPWDIYSPPNLDLVNNVENVFLGRPLGTNYSVTVAARSVNVNAVTTQSNRVAQDYALVISSGNGEVADALALVQSPIASVTVSNVTFVNNAFADTNGVSGALLLNERAGANPPGLDNGGVPWPGGSNGFIMPGTLSQWRFYVLTNEPCYTNAAFVTFRSAQLAVPPGRLNETNNSDAAPAVADIDLYVSTNPALTVLDPIALAEADKSLGRSATEMLVVSNASASAYYVGVKAEAGQAAEYAFLGVFSHLPFGTQDNNGGWTLRGINLPAVIPDGAGDPAVTNLIALAPAPISIRRIIVTNEVWHESFSDLLCTLSHDGTSVVLHSNSLPPVDPVPSQFTYIYEDNGEGDIPGAQPADGPGSLRSFIGDQGMGVWLLSLADQVSTSTGLVANLSIRFDPETLNTGAQRDMATNAFSYDFIDVPIGATNLTVCVANYSPTPMPLELYLRRGDLPTRTAWDQMLVISPAGGCLSLNQSALPPLGPGRYFFGSFNPNDVPQTLWLHAQVDLTTETVPLVTCPAAGPVAVLDDALTSASLFVSNAQPIADVEVRLHVDHPRISDMVFTLISPRGTRVPLFENRGGTTTNGLGGFVLLTNFPLTRFEGTSQPETNVLEVGQNQGTVLVSYDMYAEPDSVRVYYDGALIYDTGMVSSNASFSVPFGPGVSTNLLITANEGGNTNADTIWEFTATVVSPAPGYVWFTENTNLAQVPTKFAPPPFMPSGADTNQYYLPESLLNALAGENAFGQWQLEMWDTRAGPGEPAPQWVVWELRFAFQNTVPTPIELTYASPGTNTIPPGQVAPFFVDVPAWASRVTNILLQASGPVNLLFNPTNPPTGTNGGDTTLLSDSTGDSCTLSAGGSPPLVPGARYYLGVQNLGTSNVTAALETVFDIFVHTLKDGVVFFNSSPGAADATDYYLFTVSSNAVRAQFEINGPTADLTLVARKGVPPPTLANFTYLSANPGPNDELITLFDYSSPVPLTPGDWYLAAVNVAGESADYAIRATEFSTHGTNIIITDCQMPGDSLCLAWDALPGVKYYVQGKPDVKDTDWLTVSPTITATDTRETYCVPLPSPCHFFRVHEGLVVVPWVPPVGITNITASTNGVRLEWSTRASNQFQVQWATSLVPLAWNTFTNVLRPTNGTAAFLDDGSQCGGLEGPRYYRLRQSP